jgi:hypothetical protein
MNFEPGDKQLRKITYLFSFAIQIFGSLFIVWKDLPAFRQIVFSPGKQLATSPYDDTAIVAVLIIMQLAYWYRLLRVAIPFGGPSMALSHLFLFLGRLNFIFGSTLFSIVLFRHVPELGPDVDLLLMAHRGVLFVISLFTLFCFTLELERLGTALGETQRS